MVERTQGGSRVRPNELLERAHAASERARRSGALVSLDTQLRILHDSGISFLVRVSPNLARKQAAEAGRPDTAGDPLGPPYERDLYVGDLSETHVALLNKFNVLDDHLLLVTRAPAGQTDMLDRSDFEALLIGLAACDGLAFYNGGPEAGASQPRKHLQLVPLPLAERGPALPLEDLIAAADLDRVAQLAGLPFRHAATRVDPRWLEDPAAHANDAGEAVRNLWRNLGYDPDTDRQPAPYNLLSTRRFMWLVPRTRAGLPGLPVNSLGFAGALLAMDETAFERLTAIGPMQLLSAVAHRKTAAH